MTRHYLFIGGVFGAAGITLAASAAHAEAARGLRDVSFILLAHGVLIASLALHGSLGVVLRLGSALIAFGTALFAADLVIHAFRHHHLFPHAAPLGGFAMIIGWVILALAALSRKN